MLRLTRFDLRCLIAYTMVACACGPDPSTTDSGTGTTDGATSSSSATSSGSTTSSSTDSSTAPTSTAPTTGAPGTTTSDLPGEGEPCSPDNQDCAEGLKCTLHGGADGWTENLCLPAAPDGGGAGAPCQTEPSQPIWSGLDNCAGGFVCTNFDNGEQGECVELCDEDDECPGMGAEGLCDHSPGPGLLGLCAGPCDPTAQDCAPPQGCYGGFAVDGFVCHDPGAAADGDACEVDDDCAPGLSCSPQALVDGCDAGATGCCTPFCLVSGGDAACAPAEDCVPYFAEPPQGWQDIGVCRLP